jgi:1,5-anhydro-D-fructose reductase (1,5-anhydro-D-mannitol-forming)
MLGAINNQPGNKVVAVMSSSLERARAYAAETGIPRAYDSLDTILADPEVDAVYISTTNELHHSQTLAAARAGKHVLCEKPLALSLEEALEMVQACRAAGVVLGTNHHLRNLAAHRIMRRLIATGAIGQPLAVRIAHAVYLPPHLQTWRLNRAEAGGGVILDITVHDADTLRFVSQDEVETVTALSVQQGLASGEVEDGVMGVMRLGSGVLVQFHDAFTVRHASTGFEVYGTEGSLIGEGVMNQNQAMRLFLRRGDNSEAIELGPRESIYSKTVEAFYRATQGQGRPVTTGEDGLRSLAIALAVRESASTGRAVNPRYT